MVRPKRRAVRKADVEYDRAADREASISSGSSFDEERTVQLEDDELPALSGRDFYEAERPPHY